jgi:hypothetical protein
MLTQSTGSRCGVPVRLGFFGVCSAMPSVNTVLTAARLDVLRKVRLLGPFALSFDMLIRDAFPEVTLYQDRLMGAGEHLISRPGGAAKGRRKSDGCPTFAPAYVGRKKKRSPTIALRDTARSRPPGVLPMREC